MSTKWSLSGEYNSRQYVLIKGEEFQEKLKLLGCFGTNLDSTTRKEGSRRGPADRQLIDLNLGISEPTTVLSLHEAFFLAHALGCLSVCSTASDVLSLDTCWDEFRKYHDNSNSGLDFAIEYGVYFYFRSRSWVVKSGNNYGANFLLYREGPSIDHAQFAVMIIFDNDREGMYRWDSLQTFHRVVHSVSKELLLVFIEMLDSSELRFNNPECIKKMRITNRIFSGSLNVPGKNQSQLIN